MFIEYPNTKYGEGIEIDEYNGTYSLVVANRGMDGNVYKKWCYPQGKGKGAGPISKSLPWKIKLGDSIEEAVEMLQAISQALEEDGPVGPDLGVHDQSNVNDDLPF